MAARLTRLMFVLRAWFTVGSITNTWGQVVARDNSLKEQIIRMCATRMIVSFN